MLRTFISHLSRRSVRSSRVVVQATRTLSTAPDVDVVPPPPSDASEPKQYSARVMKLVDEIANMTLIEVSDLNAALKERLNLPDMPAVGMPMMMAPGMAAPAAQATDQGKADEDVTALKTIFTVRLKSFDDKQKIAIIKEVKNLMPGMNLVQAKKFVESAPAVMKEDAKKEEADEMKKKLEALGAKVDVE